MIDFTFPPEVEEIRLKVRSFMDERVRPEWDATDESERSEVVKTIVKLRKEAREDRGLWLPHMPPEWGGMGLGPTAMAAVSAEASKVRIGPFILNAQAPDEGNPAHPRKPNAPHRRMATTRKSNPKRRPFAHRSLDEERPPRVGWRSPNSWGCA